MERQINKDMGKIWGRKIQQAISTTSSRRTGARGNRIPPAALRQSQGWLPITLMHFGAGPGMWKGSLRAVFFSGGGLFHFMKGNSAAAAGFSLERKQAKKRHQVFGCADSALGARNSHQRLLPRADRFWPGGARLHQGSGERAPVPLTAEHRLSG